MVRWVLFVIVYLILGFYALQAVKTASGFSWAAYLFIAISLVVLGNFIYQFSVGEAQGRVLSVQKSYAFGLLLTMLTFILVLIIFLFSEDIFRLIAAAYQRISGNTTQFSLPQRRRFLSLIAIGLGAIPFGALLYGMYKGKYNYKVLRYTMEFDDLPAAFDGYRLTQISDVHSGSFDNKEKVAYAIDLVNQQKSDAILFTGDLVNNKTEEMYPWQELFATLKELQHAMGFDLLLNENRFLQRGTERIALIGVENWGKGGFKKAGDLAKASAGVARDDFKILMSHDPSHWEEKIVPDANHYHLTLSGHTHGMQFGIEIPGWIKWSPVKWRYEQWAGIYEKMGQYINVNRGFGYLGYPGRVGIWPEITVITLKKKSLT